MDTVDGKNLENKKNDKMDKEKSKPERMCICCRRKGKKSEFFRISEQNGKYIFDREMKVQARGFYVCKTNECIEKLSKNRKYKIEIEQLVKMLEQIKSEKKSIIDILKPMKNSEYFVFGIDETIEGVQKEKVKLLIIPKDIKTKYIEEFEKLKENFEKDGKTLAAWARENGYKPREVYLVVGGQNKAKYGKGFEIARKLGLK